MGSLAAVILAAGKGTRMKSDLVKVLHPLAGTPMLSYPLELARSLNPERLVVVVGFQAELVQEKFKANDLIFALQAAAVRHRTCGPGATQPCGVSREPC